MEATRREKKKRRKKDITRNIKNKRERERGREEARIGFEWQTRRRGYRGKSVEKLVNNVARIGRDVFETLSRGDRVVYNF